MEEKTTTSSMNRVLGLKQAINITVVLLCI